LISVSSMMWTRYEAKNAQNRRLTIIAIPPRTVADRIDGNVAEADQQHADTSRRRDRSMRVRVIAICNPLPTGSRQFRRGNSSASIADGTRVNGPHASSSRRVPTADPHERRDN
jgi:hypothetical protein